MDSLYEEIFIAGAGGQGVLQLGKILAQAAVDEGWNATYYPAYGAEIRGGTANCSVIISDREIASPVVTAPNNMIMMNSPSLAKFAGRLARGGLLLVNSSLAGETGAAGKGGKLVKIRATELAQACGDIRCANVVLLGRFIGEKKLLPESAVAAVIKSVFARKPEVIEMNLKALKKGMGPN
jgi:2-oxoglutarate ferredoxin oxidoreductase subunit gamma